MILQLPNKNLVPKRDLNRAGFVALPAIIAQEGEKTA
jgi:hypothetical protein